MTAVVSKQLQPVYDKPMVYYPLNTLMLAGIREVLVISTPQSLPLFRNLLGNGSRLGIELHYASQAEPLGIAHAITVAQDAWGTHPIALILGDNLFHAESGIFRNAIATNTGATIFGYSVQNPSRYGVVEFDTDGGVLSIEEKPQAPRSKFAIPGFYVYNEDCYHIARALLPSKRGELEITDVHKAYLAQERLRVVTMQRGTAWLDTGTPESLLEAATFIHAIEKRQGQKVACLEETALLMGYLSAEEFLASVASLPKSDYRAYCMGLTR